MFIFLFYVRSHATTWYFARKTFKACFKIFINLCLFACLIITVNALKSSLFYLQTESALYKTPNSAKSSNKKSVTLTPVTSSLKAFLHCRPCFRSTSVKFDTMLIAHNPLHLGIVHVTKATTDRRDLSIGISQKIFNRTLHYPTTQWFLEFCTEVQLRLWYFANQCTEVSKTSSYCNKSKVSNLKLWVRGHSAFMPAYNNLTSLS